MRMVTDRTSLPSPQLVFGEFRLDRDLRRLYLGTEEVKLSAKPFNTLEFLIVNRQRVVPREELLRSVWRESRDPNVVDQALTQVRKALGQDATRPRYIEAVKGQGFRFVAAVVDGVALENNVVEETLSPHHSQVDTPARLSAPDSGGLANLDYVPMVTGSNPLAHYGNSSGRPIGCGRWGFVCIPTDP